MTNEELRVAVKADVKGKGLSLRDVSVSVKNVGYSTTIRLVIRNPHVNRSELKTLLKKYESVDRDERTGEILAGGNVYVNACYAEGIFEEVSKEWEPFAVEMMEKKEEIVKLSDGLYLLWDSQRQQYEVKEETMSFAGRRLCYSPEVLSRYIYMFKNFGTITV